MLRRLHPEQPDSFAFTEANLAWAEGQIAKYPEGRQASAIIPLLWRAQEQEGWLSRPAIETVADMLGLPYIRALEVATFYFMFQLQPVGAVAHIQICGTLSCMICGAEDLMAVCREKIAPEPFMLSEDGKLSWEEVECLGACSNAPMAQIGKDYYEDLTAEGFGKLLDALRAGDVPVPGPQNGRYAAEPVSGLTSLKDYDAGKPAYNASAALAVEIGDTVKRIDGTEVPLTTPWITHGANHGGDATPPKPANDGSAAANRGKTAAQQAEEKAKAAKPTPAKEAPADETGVQKQEAQAKTKAKPAAKAKAGGTTETKPAPATAETTTDGGEADVGTKPATLTAPRDGEADNLKLIKGVGPKLEALLHSMGFFHFDQVAKWTADEVAWVDANLQGFKGRVSRDNWIDQAKVLAEGGDTEFSAKSRKGGK